MYEFENNLYQLGYSKIAGTDEVGRGPLAGPLVCAAVILDPDTTIYGLNDSKKLSEAKREKIAIEIKKYAVAIIPTCENMVGPNAFKQGDVLTAYNGKTMEIWHTDAEGRLILADGLSYADKHYKAKAIVDIATLTGASVIALGQQIAALMSTDEKLKNCHSLL